METPENTLFGLYVHWPYCLSKCPYCDFYSRVENKIDELLFLAAYKRDLDIIPPKKKITSIYFGGGTPCLMSVNLFQNLLNEIKKRFILADDAEITVEVNPDAINDDKMQTLADLGVNRLSIGVQSLNESDLMFLGRRHTVKSAITCIESAKKTGFKINMDLIYARPNQTLAAWEKELNEALSLGLNHYSLYQLTIEEKTVFGKKQVKAADDEVAADLFLKTLEIMEKAGRPAYEVSNFAVPSEKCRHNLTYWLGCDYGGIGPAAHGRLGLTATESPSSIDQWLKKGIQKINLTQTERNEEKLITVLRLPNHQIPIKLLNPIGIQKALDSGWISLSDESVQVTKTGLLFSNTLAVWLCP